MITFATFSAITHINHHFKTTKNIGTTTTVSPLRNLVQLGKKQSTARMRKSLNEALTMLMLLRLFGYANSLSFRPVTTRTARKSSSVTSLSAGAERKSSRSRRKERKENTSALGTLEWETFDFSDSPKWDGRFGNDGDIHLASNKESWDQIATDEETQDRALQAEFERRHRIWNTLDDKLIEDATNELLPFIGEERWEKICSTMGQRTQQTKFLYENPANPSNVFACLRTLDSFGIQHVDVVIQSGMYEGKAALSQKRGMRTAMGSAKWLTLNNHLTTELAIESIRKENYHIVCTDVNPSSKDIRDVNWDASGKKLCVIMGNEQRGISPAVKAMADESFYLPMCGMAESFNLGVATAITCAHMSAASKDGNGPLRPGDISEKEYKTLLLKGALNSVKPKLARALFNKAGIQLPKEINFS